MTPLGKWPIELLEWGHTFLDFTVSKRARMFVLKMKSKVFFNSI